MDSDVNIVSFWSSLTEEGTEVRGTVSEAFKLQTNTLSCTNLNAHWHYSTRRKGGWKNFAQPPSYMDKLLMRSRDIAGVTLRVGVLVVCISTDVHQMITARLRLLDSLSFMLKIT